MTLPDPLHVSRPVREAAESKRTEAQVRSLREVRQERTGSALRLLTGDEHALLLNVYRHNGQSGRPLGYSYDEYRGKFALASASEDARAPTHNDGLMRYETTLRLNPNGTYEIIDLSE